MEKKNNNLSVVTVGRVVRGHGVSQPSPTDPAIYVNRNLLPNRRPRRVLYGSALDRNLQARRNRSAPEHRRRRRRIIVVIILRFRFII